MCRDSCDDVFRAVRVVRCPFANRHFRLPRTKQIRIPIDSSIKFSVKEMSFLRREHEDLGVIGKNRTERSGSGLGRSDDEKIGQNLGGELGHRTNATITNASSRGFFDGPTIVKVTRDATSFTPSIDPSIDPSNRSPTAVRVAANSVNGRNGR
jgi:hypothetical protein